MPPRVSILVPTFNAARWLPEALGSALAQTLPSTEILVVDDGSTDGTPDVLASYGDRIAWERVPNGGARAARNRLLQRARGEWVQFLDADDLIDPDKLERQLDELAGHPEADALAAPARFEDGSLCNAPRDEDVWEALLGARLGITTANLWRREAVTAVGGFDPERLGLDEYRLLARLLLRGSHVLRSSHPRAVYRRVNPDSAYSRRGARNEVLLAEFAMDTATALEQQSELDDDRRARFADFVFERARSLWNEDREASRRCFEQAHELDPTLPERLRRSSRAYGRMVATFGFGAAQLADGISRRIRGLRPR